MSETLPNPGQLVSSAVKAVFKQSMDELLVDLGRPITLILKPSEADCPNCSYHQVIKRSNNIYNGSNPNPSGPLNIPFPQGQNCPVCQGKGKLITPRSVTYTATISKKFSEREIMEAGLAQIENNTVKTNTVIQSLADVDECVSALIDGDLYVKIGRRIKTGLQSLIRVKQFWKMTT